MKKSILIYPAILVKNAALFKRKMDLSRAFSGVQIDVMDGKFVKNRTFEDTRKIIKIIPENLFVEVQLMVEDPLSYIFAWSSIADRYILHIESMRAPRFYIALARAMKKSIGLALNPETPITYITPFIPLIDMVLVMTVEPGASGQKFIPETLKKVKMLAQNKKIHIEVDGGINEKTASMAAHAGATTLVAGSYFWKHHNILFAKNKLEQSLYNAKKKN